MMLTLNQFNKAQVNLKPPQSNQDEAHVQNERSQEKLKIQPRKKNKQ